MIPEKDQSVIVVFRSGIQIEGKVIEWTDKKTVLSSVGGSSTIVIYKTSEDVLFFKILNAKTEYEDIKKKTNKTQEDIKNIAELKKELNELEKKEIEDKLHNQSLGEFREVHYGIPTNIKIKSVSDDTGEKTTGKGSGIGSKLQDLFSKKH